MSPLKAGARNVVLTQVKTPRETFFMPQRLIVPPFQRAYVWTQEGQWEPLWDDVRRLSEKVLEHETQVSHFLGAIVTQQMQGEIGTLETWTVIDGQQRLTTLQLMMDAIKEEVETAGLPDIAKQMSDLVENPSNYQSGAMDRFKVTPTSRDIEAFIEVMSAPSPIDYLALERSGNPRFASAHEFFATSVRTWLGAPPDSAARAQALVQSVANLLQLVVIALGPNEDAQEIFETLNARGTPLTAADLIKNFLFQRMNAEPGVIARAASHYWAPFETKYWETQVQAGTTTYTRSSLFLSQWLVAQTGKDVPSKLVFSEFKKYVQDSGYSTEAVLVRIRASGDEYQRQADEIADTTGDLTRLGLFTYRASTLKSEALRPVVIWLTDPSEVPAVPSEQLNKAIGALESWLVRRACVRAGNKDYRDVSLRILTELRNNERARAGDVIEDFLTRQSSEGSYWPLDEDVRSALRSMPIYKRFQRGRLRMLLEAIEDHSRGWDDRNPKHESRIRRGNLTIEHLMPQHWETHWEPPRDGVNRDDLVQSLGNLTLTSGSLNTHVSNGPWFSTADHQGKYEELSKSKYTSVSLTQEALRLGQHGWTDSTIRTRTELLIDSLIEVWPTPTNAVGLDRSAEVGAEAYIGITDLLAAGLLEPGQILFARRVEFRDTTATVTEDGQLQVGDASYWSPTGAGKAASEGRFGGWSYWVTDPDNGVRLKDLRDQYADDRGLRAKNEDYSDD